MAGGAARPVARATDEDAWPVADGNAEEPVAGGSARPVTSAADEDASVVPITEGTKPVARAAGPITEGAKRRMSQGELSAWSPHIRFQYLLMSASASAQTA